MNGAAALVALRRQRQRPIVVDVWLGYDATESWRDWHEVGRTAQIEVTDDESISLLDLRCLVGLWVMVGGLDDGRVQAFHEAAVKAGARVVISAAYRRDRGVYLAETLRLEHGVN